MNNGSSTPTPLPPPPAGVDPQLAAIVGLHLHGLSVDEIAATLGVPAKVVRVMKRIAKKRGLY